MAASKIIMQSADGASVGLTIPDGLTSGERTIALGANLSGVTAYHLLNGEVSVSNEVITVGFGVYLYTGNTTTRPSFSLGMDIESQWGDSATEKFGYLIEIKSRSATGNWIIVDSVRGNTKYISSNATTAETIDANLFALSTTSGNTTVNIGTSTATNTNGVTYVMTVYQTTHRKMGTTNQGKAYTEHYNPFTGLSISGYEGSVLAGHEIPHSLGRKLSLNCIKNLTIISDWIVQKEDNSGGYLNSTAAFIDMSPNISNSRNEASITLGINSYVNASTNQHIMYGWANSYFDESNKLIGNYEIGVYQGTVASGNKVKTRGKPAWVMIKRLDSTGSWAIYDNQRGLGVVISPNLSDGDSSSQPLGTFNSDGFTVNNTVWSDINASGGQYLYMVVYDNDNGSGKSKYPKATDSSQLQINALIPLAQGIDGNGAKNTILSKNETITGLTYTQGKNYVYCDKNGSYGVKPHRPRYLSTDLVRTYAGESPDYYDVKSNKWFNCDAGAELVTNGKFDSGVTTGWTGNNATLSIVNQTLRVTTTSNYGAVYQTLTNLVVGKRYRYILSGSLVTATQFILRIGVPPLFTTYYYNSAWQVSSGVVYLDFVALYTTMAIECTFGTTTGLTGSIDSVSVFQTDITPTSETTDSRNYLDAIVYADHNGQVEYVEQLPKTQYVDEIKANEFKGKNTIWGYAVIDCSTTQVTIKDIFGISSVIRTALGVHRFYFENTVDNLWFGWAYGAINGAGYLANESTRTLNYIDINTFNLAGTNGNNSLMTINFYGGRN